MINVSKTRPQVDPKEEDPKSLGFVCFVDFLTDWECHGMKITIMVATIEGRIWRCQFWSNHLHQIQVNQLPNGWMHPSKRGEFLSHFASRKSF